MKIKQFALWLADLDPRFGTEAGKRRPVLIVQTDLLNKRHPSVLICPITTKVIKKVSILRVLIPSGTGGLNHGSSVMIDQVRAIDKRRLLHPLGELPQALCEQVREGLRIVLDLGEA